MVPRIPTRTLQRRWITARTWHCSKSLHQRTVHSCQRGYLSFNIWADFAKATDPCSIICWTLYVSPSNKLYLAKHRGRDWLIDLKSLSSYQEECAIRKGRHVRAFWESNQTT
jgi:hypothetical protein